MELSVLFLSQTPLLKLSLLDKIFEILAEGSAMGSPVSLAIMERTVILSFGMNHIASALDASPRVDP